MLGRTHFDWRDLYWWIADRTWYVIQLVVFAVLAAVVPPIMWLCTVFAGLVFFVTMISDLPPLISTGDIPGRLITHLTMIGFALVLKEVLRRLLNRIAPPNTVVLTV